jgi:hypothetical protein
MIVTMFKAVDWFMDDPLEIIEAKYENIQKMEKQGIGFSVFDDEGCVGCGGIIKWEEDIAEAWLRLDKRALDTPVSAIRIIQEGYRIVSDVYKGRIFCWVDETWPIAQRLVKWFCFEKTKTQRMINDKIYYMWELKDGNYLNDSRVGDVSSRADTARQHDGTAVRSPSPNLRIQCGPEESRSIPKS